MSKLIDAWSSGWNMGAGFGSKHSSKVRAFGSAAKKEASKVYIPLYGYASSYVKAHYKKTSPLNLIGQGPKVIKKKRKKVRYVVKIIRR